MTSWQLWHNLIMERARYPLFIRLAPRALNYEAADLLLWHFLSVYTVIGYMILIALQSLIFRSEFTAIIVTVVTFPAVVITLLSLVLSPFVVGGGIFFGLGFALDIGSALQRLHRSGAATLLRATPPGEVGLIRAVSAAALRQRHAIATVGIYVAPALHFTLSLGLSIIVFIVFSFYGWPDVSPPPLGYLLGMLVGSLLAMGLVHLDNRQYLMLGVTAGIFAGTVLANDIDARTAALSLFAGVGLMGAFIIALVGGGAAFLFSSQLEATIAALVIFTMTLLGFGLALVAKEYAIQLIWRVIFRYTGINSLAE